MIAFSKALVMLGSLSGLGMFIYAYLVLQGDIPLGAMTLHALRPDKVTLTYGIYAVVVPGIGNSILRGLGPVMRPAGSVPWFVAGLVPSVLVIAQMVYVTWNYLTGSYDPSPLQFAAIVTWDMLMVLEIYFIILSARLLQRSWFGEGGAHDLHR